MGDPPAPKRPVAGTGRLLAEAFEASADCLAAAHRGQMRWISRPPSCSGSPRAVAHHTLPDMGGRQGLLT